VILTLYLLLFVSVTLCVRAVRWDRWAHYENNNRRWWEDLPGESYASFKAWRAWRASWNRALAATAISSVAIIWGIAVAVATWRRGVNWWLIAAVLLHAAPVMYFYMRWGPDFRHPAPSWGG
jgi:hypothetical protein